MTFNVQRRDTPIVRTNYRISDQYAHSLTGVVAQGSYTGESNDGTLSGYVSVSHGLGGTPRTAFGHLVQSAGGGKSRYCHLKGIGATYVTFMINSAVNVILTGSDVTIIWKAIL